MSEELKSNGLKILVEKIRCIIENNSQTKFSIIDKDLLLSHIRKLYDIALSMEINDENEITTKHEIVIDEMKNVNHEFNKGDHDSKEKNKSVTQNEIGENKLIKNAVEDKIIIQEEQIKIPVETPKPTFDDLVNKVKEQMNHQPKPQELHFVSNTEDDEDQQEIFSDFKLDILFNTKTPHELSDRLSLTHIEDIAKAMGLNERIFTLNELFDGNNTDFERALNELNNASNFVEAKEIIATKLAVKYNWLTDSKIKKARDFVKLVKRRFV